MSSEPFERDDGPKAKRPSFLGALLEAAGEELCYRPDSCLETSSLLRVALLTLVWIGGLFVASLASALAVMLIVLLGRVLHIW